MSQHYLALINRTLTDIPQTSSEQIVERETVRAAALQPIAHVFGQSWLFRTVQPGDVIWMVGFLRQGRHWLPPSIDVRLQVKDKYSHPADVSDNPYLARLLQPGKFLVTADPVGSYYLPWNNALDLLTRLRFQGISPSLFSNALEDHPQMVPLYHLAMRLQTTRRLTSVSGTELDSYSHEITERDRVFLSYRWAEATPFAKALLVRLSAIGMSCWWDRWSMPRTISELRLKSDGHILDDPFLNEIITDAISHCPYAISLETNGYGTPGTWASIEKAMFMDRASQGLVHLYATDRLTPQVAQWRDSQKAEEYLDALIDRIQQDRQHLKP